ncbi:MAG TPA: 2-oxo acid dehydrogenase subunit E2, partial [Acidimicrobiia bacterium]
MADQVMELGPNAGLVDEMYRRYQENPDSIAPVWREFFADYTPRATVPVPPPPPAPPAPQTTVAAAPAPPPQASGGGDHARQINTLDGEEPTPLRGPAKAVVTNMEASLEVPTATSVRTVPAKLLEINRQILNNHLARTIAGKVSFTHIIGYAVLRALQKTPGMNASYGLVDGQPAVARHQHVNLGLAIDQQKADGTRSLLVPNIKSADTLDFAQFHAAYEELLRKVRSKSITPDDFAGTTVSITNPGTIGTMHSVPRLMPGQGVIVGVGSIDYPPEYQGADPDTIARIGVSKVVTLTSTYDHRVIQGAESGEFLGAIHHMLLGEDHFYDDIFHSFGVPYEPARWVRDAQPFDDVTSLAEKAICVHQLINMYRVRGHLIAHLDPLDAEPPHIHPELDPLTYGLTIWDLPRQFVADGLAGRDVATLDEILHVLRDAYCRTLAIEYMHIQDPEQKRWIQQHVEGQPTTLNVEEQRHILGRLNAAEVFERFLHTRYVGQKRFGLEGAESTIVLLDALLDAAAGSGVAEVVMGMAHRG